MVIERLALGGIVSKDQTPYTLQAYNRGRAGGAPLSHQNILCTRSHPILRSNNAPIAGSGFARAET
jgi:hypothetical protein